VKKLLKSFSWLNLLENKKMYDAVHGSEFANFTFKRKEYREMLDFHSI